MKALTDQILNKGIREENTELWSSRSKQRLSETRYGALIFKLAINVSLSLRNGRFYSHLANKCVVSCFFCIFPGKIGNMEEFILYKKNN